MATPFGWYTNGVPTINETLHILSKPWIFPLSCITMQAEFIHYMMGFGTWNVIQIQCLIIKSLMKAGGGLWSSDLCIG